MQRLYSKDGVDKVRLNPIDVMNFEEQATTAHSLKDEQVQLDSPTRDLKRYKTTQRIDISR